MAGHTVGLSCNIIYIIYTIQYDKNCWSLTHSILLYIQYPTGGDLTSSCYKTNFVKVSKATYKKFFTMIKIRYRGIQIWIYTYL